LRGELFLFGLLDAHDARGALRGRSLADVGEVDGGLIGRRQNGPVDLDLSGGECGGAQQEENGAHLKGLGWAFIWVELG
jgi:hypothetical protein